MHYTIFYTLIGWFEIVSALYTHNSAKGYTLMLIIPNSPCVVPYNF